MSANKLASSLLLSHATLEEGKTLAKEILGPVHHSKIETGNHPDLHLYHPEGKSHLHPMANIRELIREMYLPPFEAEAKVFLITEAEKMLPPSSNALLKTLEEPPEDTYILLLTDHPNALLPTIQSRLFPITYIKSTPEPPELTPLFSHVEQKNWPEALSTLSTLAEEEPEPLFQAYLEWISQKKDPSLFQKALAQVASARTALNHNLKLPSVFLNMLLEIAQ
ncbi:MAG: DNA polymerase III subunit gamma/tau [Chlamydiae bacterium]|nr:DNA polymerase III subunit gamma/tau [Chlamydiota bacterium]